GWGVAASAAWRDPGPGGRVGFRQERDGILLDEPGGPAGTHAGRPPGLQRTGSAGAGRGAIPSVAGQGHGDDLPGSHDDLEPGPARGYADDRGRVGAWPRVAQGGAGPGARGA